MTLMESTRGDGDGVGGLAGWEGTCPGGEVAGKHTPGSSFPLLRLCSGADSAPHCGAPGLKGLPALPYLWPGTHSGRWRMVPSDACGDKGQGKGCRGQQGWLEVMRLAQTSGCPLWPGTGDTCSSHQRGLSVLSRRCGPQTAQNLPFEWGWAERGQALWPTGLPLATKDKAEVTDTPASGLQGLSGVPASLRRGRMPTPARSSRWFVWKESPAFLCYFTY